MHIHHDIKKKFKNIIKINFSKETLITSVGVKLLIFYDVSYSINWRKKFYRFTYV